MLVTLVLFGALVAVDLGLFGWLIFRSLSQREINRIILETRAEAEELAGRLAEEAERWNDDLYTAVATNAETRTYIDQVLSKREIVEVVRVLDKEQRVVFEGARIESEGEDFELSPGEVELPSVVAETFRRDTPFETVEVPVGHVGTFVIGLRRAEIEQRLEVLRRDLIRMAAVISALSLVLLGSAYGFIVLLMRRAGRAEEQVQEAERLAYVGTLASGLAHEIRSPLNSLNLNMQMLEEELDSGGPPTADRGGSRRLLQITQAEISRLERLVSDFLSYARPRGLELEELPARELLERVHDVYRGRAALQGLRLEVQDKTGGARVRVDRGQIHQLLLNLTENAVQATQGAERSPEVRLVADRRNDRVALAVIDNGVGMSEEERLRATEVFFSMRKGGTGLGLAIVDRIARNHDGSLEIESKPGEGTRVEVLLPVA
jgi:signal transduction histidine kinase